MVASIASELSPGFNGLPGSVVPLERFPQATKRTHATTAVAVA
jgi:hypothetical protein